MRAIGVKTRKHLSKLTRIYRGHLTLKTAAEYLVASRAILEARDREHCRLVSSVHLPLFAPYSATIRFVCPRTDQLSLANYV